MLLNVVSIVASIVVSMVESVVVTNVVSVVFSVHADREKLTANSRNIDTLADDAISLHTHVLFPPMVEIADAPFVMGYP